MKDLPLLMQNLSATADILEPFIAGIPKDCLHVRRRPGFWTIAEHVQHLADVQPMLLERIQTFETDAKVQFEPYFPDKDQSRPPIKVIDAADALQRFALTRNRQLDLLHRIDPAAWKKGATHPEYADYNLYILVRHIMMHDYWHMYRIEELWLTRDAYLTELQ